ncbi:hypothetical protein GCM10027589_55320 [Actinocorallia lasiicapitis]
MADPWEPEWDVSPSLVRVLLTEQFPEISHERVRLLGVGWDNVVYLIDETWVFRFPRRAVALPGVRREIELLPGLASPLPIPRPEFLGAPGKRFAHPFWGARLIPGRELADAAVPDEDRTPIAVQIGRFLRALHDQEAPAGLPVDPMGRGDAPKRAALARKTLASLTAQGVYEPDDTVEALLTSGEAFTGSPQTPVLAHGDLHLRHLLVAPDATVAGVIDWGDLCLAVPAVDLSIAFAAFRGEARAALFAEYGPIEPEAETVARVLALYLCVVLADYAAATQRHALLAEALTGIARSTDHRSTDQR